MVIADLYNQGHYDPENRGPILQTDNPEDPNSALRIYYDLAKIGEAKTRGGGYVRARVVPMSISTEITMYKFEQTLKLVRKGIETVKGLQAVNLSVLNPRMFDETIVASFEHFYDGVVVLSTREVKGSYRRYLRVKEAPNSGFCIDEVPYDIIEGRPRLFSALAYSTHMFSDYLKFNNDGTISLFGSRLILANAKGTTRLFDSLIGSAGYEQATTLVYDQSKSFAQKNFKELMEQMGTKCGNLDEKKVIDLFAGYVSTAGIGLTELMKYENGIATFRVRNSLCTMSEKQRGLMGPYLAGMFAGLLEMLSGKAAKCGETKCTSKGDDSCEFTCELSC
jgi:predicted hydrocarbon binding protein